MGFQRSVCYIFLRMKTRPMAMKQNSLFHKFVNKGKSLELPHKPKLEVVIYYENIVLERPKVGGKRKCYCTHVCKKNSMIIISRKKCNARPV